jgi:hypothetical protein
MMPVEADLRGLQFMPLDVVRLMDSDLFALSTGDEFKAAVALWCKSWTQLPAGSLPNDDRVLAHLSGSGPRWRKVREMALRGFILCSDGRLYHPVVCEKATEAWAMRVRQRERSVKGNKVRWGGSRSSPGDPRGDPSGDAQRDPRQHSPGDRKGQGQGQGQYSEPNGSGGKPPSDDPVQQIFDRGLAIVGDKHRSLLGKLRRSCGDIAVLGAIAECESQCPSDPVPYLIAAAERRKPNGSRTNDGFGAPGFA